MGLRILLAVTLASLLVVLAAAAYGGGQGPQVSGMTSQGNAIRFNVDGGGRPSWVETAVSPQCTRPEWAQNLAMKDGSVYHFDYTLRGHRTEHVITGRIDMREHWTVDGRVTGRCWAGPISFSVPLD